MADSQAIIVGGGIAVTDPFTIGHIPYIVSTVPPSLSATPIMAYTLGTGLAHPGIVISVNAIDPKPAADEIFRVSGGAIIEGNGVSDSVVIGRGALVNSGTNIAIGTGASATSVTCMAIGAAAIAVGNFAVAIGQGAQADGQGGAGGAVAVGNGAIAVGVNATALGRSASASGISSLAIGEGSVANANASIAISGGNANGFSSLCVGFNARARANNQVVILAGGNNPTIGAGMTGGTIVISGGTGVNLSHANNIVLGVGAATFANNTAIIGASGTPITQVVFGRGDTATVTVGAGMVWRCTDGNGNDLDMGSLTVIAPRSTGAITPGQINFQVGVVQASGNTLQPLSTGVAVISSVIADDTFLAVYDVNSGALQRVSVGAVDSGGAGFRVLRIPN